MPVYAIDKVEYGDVPQGAADFKASFRIGHDPQNGLLYVAVEVRDQSQVDTPVDQRGWDRQDGCELYFDFDHVPNAPPVLQLTFYESPEGETDAASNKWVQRGWQREGDRTVYEWAVDMRALAPENAVFAPNTSLGIFAQRPKWYITDSLRQADHDVETAHDAGK